ncbi:MAG: hypothetical protein KDD85_02835 [Parvularculaceae bacterium]|nr:hypothetical protein [Parvularculaceae bacterium]
MSAGDRWLYWLLKTARCLMQPCLEFGLTAQFVKPDYVTVRSTAWKKAPQYGPPKPIAFQSKLRPLPAMQACVKLNGIPPQLIKSDWR